MSIQPCDNYIVNRAIFSNKFEFLFPPPKLIISLRANRNLKRARARTYDKRKSKRLRTA